MNEWMKAKQCEYNPPLNPSSYSILKYHRSYMLCTTPIQLPYHVFPFADLPITTYRCFRAHRSSIIHLVQAFTYAELFHPDPRNIQYADVLGKGVKRCRSLPSVALRSFLNGTKVSRNTVCLVDIHFHSMAHVEWKWPIKPYRKNYRVQHLVVQNGWRYILVYFAQSAMLYCKTKI
jgi:hypothetical protein